MYIYVIFTPLNVWFPLLHPHFHLNLPWSSLSQPPLLSFHYPIPHSNFYRYPSISQLISVIWCFSSLPNSQIHTIFFKISGTNGTKNLFCSKKYFFLTHWRSTVKPVFQNTPGALKFLSFCNYYLSDDSLIVQWSNNITTQ